MYDPYRHEFPRDLTQEIAETRRKKAQSLCEGRRLYREVMKETDSAVNVVSMNRLVRVTAKKYGTPLPPVTRPRVLREIAQIQWENANTPIPPGVPCGTDDMMIERKHYQRSLALAIWRTVGRLP